MADMEMYTPAIDRATGRELTYEEMMEKFGNSICLICKDFVIDGQGFWEIRALTTGTKEWTGYIHHRCAENGLAFSSADDDPIDTAPD